MDKHKKANDTQLGSTNEIGMEICNLKILHGGKWLRRNTTHKEGWKQEKQGEHMEWLYGKEMGGNVNFKIGNRQKVRFWEDVRCVETLLAVK